jgi:predicted small secreted protein
MKKYAVHNNSVITNIIVAENEQIARDISGEEVFEVVEFAGINWINVDGTWIAPSPYPSWILDEETKQWVAPIDYPNDGKGYQWDEPTINWKEVLNTQQAD